MKTLFWKYFPNCLYLLRISTFGYQECINTDKIAMNVSRVNDRGKKKG